MDREEMCEAMCDNAMPKEKKQWWIFTFGWGQEHEGYYVRIFGTFESTRRKMMKRYHDDWAFQYSEEEWEEWMKEKPGWVPAEKELEVLE